MAKRTGLGRGIGALIPTTESAEARPVGQSPAARGPEADAGPDLDALLKDKKDFELKTARCPKCGEAVTEFVGLYNDE